MFTLPGNSQINEAISGPPQAMGFHKKSATGSMETHKGSFPLGSDCCQWPSPLSGRKSLCKMCKDTTNFL